MKSYFLRRLLLIPPTLIGITLLVFTITRFVPGGPMDKMLNEMARGADQGGKPASSSQSQGGLSEEQLEEMEEQFGLDKPILLAYGQWLGILPRETRISKGEYGGRGEETIGGAVDQDTTAMVILRGDGRLVYVKRGTDGVASAVTTSGNPDCHIILRGGESGPNYGADNVMETIDGLEAAKLKPAIMIDASHGNCAKDHRRMPDVFREIVRQRAAGQKAIIGAMLESNLVGGSQKFPQPLDQLVRGQSITDACIDWETTEALLREAHEVLK